MAGRIRRFWLAFHLYLGLGLGSVLAVVGLTGSALVFWETLDSWLHPALYRTTRSCADTAHDLDAWTAVARPLAPAGGRLTDVYFPHAERAVATLSYHVPAPGADWDDRYSVFVDPCAGLANGVRLWDSQHDALSGPLMAVVMRVHTSFLMNFSGLWLGNIVLSYGSVALMASLLAGLYLWWPRNGRWRAALSIKPRASAERRVYDLHKVAGALGALLLLMSLFTAIHMYEPWHGWINRSVNQISSVRTLTSPEPVSTPQAGASQLRPGQVLRIARQRVPAGVPTQLALPDGPRGVYRISLQTAAVGHDELVIDAYSGALLAHSGPRHASRGERFLAWLFPLHTGHAFGLAGRLVIFLVGFVPTLLLVTGFLRWRHKAASEAIIRARRARVA